LTTALTKLLAKCKAGGNALDLEISSEALATHYELKTWRETWEQCYDVDLYADAMEQEQINFEM
jgi:hypothetical protein